MTATLTKGKVGGGIIGVIGAPAGTFGKVSGLGSVQATIPNVTGTTTATSSSQNTYSKNDVGTLQEQIEVLQKQLLSLLIQLVAILREQLIGLE